MSVYCPECGTENPEGAKRCSVCNADLSYRASMPKYSWDKAVADTNDYSTDRSWFRSYLVESILMTLCCCLPMGIVGIVLCSQAETSFKVMDYERADRKASAARRAVIWGLVLAFVGFLVIYVGGFIED